nr:uncharacterized protein LOC109162619 isoform X4 [Ipomoea batatas]
MNIVASSRNLRPNGLKTGRVPQFLGGFWLFASGRKQTAGQLNVGGENLDMSNGEGESSSSTEGEGENIQGDLQDGKRVEIAYSDETNKNDQGSSTSKVSENLLETVTSYRGSDGKDVSQDKDEPAIDQEGEENSAATQNITIRSQYDVFSDENGIPKEMRDGSSLKRSK